MTELIENIFLMKNTVIIPKSLDEIIRDFPTLVKEGQLMQLKSLNERGFMMASLANFGNFNLLEKEHFYITGHFSKVGNNTEIKYKVRANSTFKTLSIVIPLMSLPSVFISLMSVQSNEIFIKNILIYSVLNALCFSLLCLKDKRLRLEGENMMTYMLKMYRN